MIFFNKEKIIRDNIPRHIKGNDMQKRRVIYIK